MGSIWSEMSYHKYTSLSNHKRLQQECELVKENQNKCVLLNNLILQKNWTGEQHK